MSRGLRFVLEAPGGRVEVGLSAEGPNERAELVYVGPRAAVAAVRREVEGSAGAFGHLLGPVTTPIDLHAAMRKPPLALFAPRLLEGEALVTSYATDLEPDETT